MEELPAMRDRNKFIEDMFEKGVLVNKEILERGIAKEALEKIELEQDILVVNDDYLSVIEQQSTLVDWYEVDRYRVDAEKERDDELYQNELQQIKKVHLQTWQGESSIESSTGELEDAEELLSIEMDKLKTRQGMEKVGEKSGQKDGLEEGVERESIKMISPGDKQALVSASLSITSDMDVVQFSTTLNPLSDLPLKNTPSLHLPTPALQEPIYSLLSAEVTLCFENKAKKYTPADFTSIFLSRFKFLERILRNRQDLQGTLSVDRVLKKKEKEQVSIIGIIDEIGTTKNGNLIVKVDDPSGRISVLFSKNKPDIFTLAKDLILDEVVGISGVCQGDIIFAENIVWPDIPQTTELKKGPDEEYVLFLSDFHVGSKLFLKEEFGKFLDWINGRTGNEQQRDLASKVKYIIMSGDAVDGVGIYPSQEEELEITDIRGQYAEFARLVSQIPLDKQMILCPGNHDVVHLAEPQPVFYKDFCEPLFTIPNLQLVSNPAIVRIGKKKDFSGFDVLMYHGYSFDYYVANVDSIRNGGGYNRSDLIMKFLLKRRHLAPSFKSTPYLPGHSEDPLLIRKVPDFFVTGHIHYCSVADYKGVTMISGSCWQEKTTFQEKLGHSPQPARVPIVNLKTRQVKILRFN